MSDQALITSTRARLPSLTRMLAVLIIVLSVTGVGMAAFMLTEPSLAPRQTRLLSRPATGRATVTARHDRRGLHR